MRDVVFGQVYRHAESTGLLDEETNAGASQQTVGYRRVCSAERETRGNRPRRLAGRRYG